MREKREREKAKEHSYILRSQWIRGVKILITSGRSGPLSILDLSGPYHVTYDRELSTAYYSTKHVHYHSNYLRPIKDKNFDLVLYW